MYARLSLSPALAEIAVPFVSAPQAPIPFISPHLSNGATESMPPWQQSDAMELSSPAGIEIVPLHEVRAGNNMLTYSPPAYIMTMQSPSERALSIMERLSYNRSLLPPDALPEFIVESGCLVAEVTERVALERRYGVHVSLETAVRQSIREWLRKTRPHDFSLIKTTIEVADAAITDAAIKLLRNASGHIFAQDRIALEMIRDRGLMSKRFDMDQVKKRAREFDVAGVPPIFERGYELEINGERFPAVDFVLEFVSGRYAGVDHTARRKKRIAHVPPARLADVRHFRAYAFDGESISPQLLAELLEHVRNDFRVRTDDVARSLEHYRSIVDSLQQSLASMPDSGRLYKRYSGENPLGIIARRMWHLDYTLGDRERIAREFVKRVKNGDRRYSVHIMNMSLLFPEIVDREELSVKAVNSREGVPR